ncbi:MAG: Holliday junction branch migration protein RuvA [Patescibacteria group bacterium]|nr:Holliday junction branch migration protein RuvA [Patescibacteria group bacterium]
MIGSVSGKVVGIIRETVVLEAGGVGYRIMVPTATLLKMSDGDTLFLWTHLAVRENAQDLYGFETREELQWFELLLTVSGVGPRSALAIMNSADTRSLEMAVKRNDAASLTKAFGIGKKTAEKVVLELREKVGALDEAEHVDSSDSDVVDALVSLGYSAREAREAVGAISKDLETPESRIREAIRLASRVK